jgi:cell wall-associated NlpC family hydrolase
MPRRLLAFAVSCAVAVVHLVGPAGAARPVKAVGPVKSPVHFVLPKHPKPLALGLRAVRLARGQLGAPYRYGGASPAGFDCSGLVMWVYGRLGIPLPHNAAALYGVGRPVGGSALRPGDLLFFHGLGHVGLYIGRGRMIHAPQSGQSVEIQSLAVRRGSLVGARRIVRN